MSPRLVILDHLRGHVHWCASQAIPHGTVHCRTPDSRPIHSAVSSEDLGRSKVDELYDAPVIQENV